MSAVSRDHRAELQVLGSQKGAITPLSRGEALDFALNLFEMLGQRFGQPKLGVHQPMYDQVHRSFFEIQKRLGNGQKGFTEHDCPQTFTIVDGFRLASRTHLDFFAELKERSYGILPFPQKAILIYQSPELGVLAKVETVRLRAFNQMLACLRIEIVEDQKGVEPPPLTLPRPLSAEEELALTKVYFGGGAVVYEGRTVYFSEMVGMWGSFNEISARKRGELLAKMSASGWAPPDPAPVAAFSKHKGNSFQRFLILCSLDVAQKNLGIQFSPAVADLVEKKFESEQARSDFCYFSTFLRRFYELDMSNLNRNSGPLIRPFQLSFFLTRNFGVLPEHQNSLLLILMKMDSRWDEKKLPSFCGRRWEQPPLEHNEVDSFRTAWTGFQQILSVVAKRAVLLDALTPEDEALLKDPDSWNLLFLLWKSPERKCMIAIVLELSKLRNFSVTFASILSFYRENGGYSDQNAEAFIGNYQKAVQALEQNGVEVSDTHHILFDPPFEISSSMSLNLDRIAESTKRFVELMKPYEFPKGKEYCLMLRHFIFHPDPLMFELLQQVPNIGAKPTEALLWDALSKAHEPFEPVPSEEARGRAVGITLKIQETYRFTDMQIFSIYLEVIRLIIRKEETVILKFAQIVEELVHFCPAVQKKDIYFLLRYHPNEPVVPPPGAVGTPLMSVTPEHVASLSHMRNEWAKTESQSNRFVIDQGFYKRFIGVIEELVLPLSRVCQDQGVSAKFGNTLQESLLSAFLPPLQPLTDYLRITDLTVDGPYWGEPSWRGHLGQLKFILREANVGIYLNWSLLKGRPVLFLSFFDIEKREASSAFIPIEVPNDKIQPNRRNFYGFLLTLGQQVLKEEASQNVPADAPEIPNSWAQVYTGVEETLSQYSSDLIEPEHIEAVWEFLRNLKLAYRNRFLSRLANARLPGDLVYEPEAVAVQGHIFSSHPRGSLLPEPILRLQTNSQFYIPDADEKFVGACRNRFNQPTDKLEPLSLYLNMPDGKYEISYHVRTVDQVTGEIEHRRERNEVAPPVGLTQGHYVTLSAKGVSIPLRYPLEALENSALFQRYFDYHNLLLKASAHKVEANRLASATKNR